MEESPRFIAQPTVDISSGKSGYFLYLRWKEKGDEGAFTELWERYAPLVYNITLSRLGNEDDALDASQETFIALTKRRIPEIPTEKQWRAYIKRVAHNTAIDLWRKLNRHEVYPYAEDADEVGRDGRRINVRIDGEEQIFPEEEVMRRFRRESPEREVSIRELRGILQEAIEKLENPSYRREVRMAYFEDRTYREAAAQLGIKYDPFKIHIHRAKGPLRRSLERFSYKDLMDMLSET